MNSQESKKLENKGLNILKKYLKKNDTVIAAISGGSDSIFLLYLLRKLQAEIKFKIVVAHINHQLRGRDSALDEKFVKHLAQESFELKRADIKQLSQKRKQGLEETGRIIRYEFFKKLVQKHKAKFIITAHHADDNLETVILNFARGSGMQGLSGMRESDPPLLRPLLSFSKKEIGDYLKFQKIPFRIDKSNSNPAFKRNFIRSKIIPELQKINPNIAKTVAKNSENIREVNIFLEEEADKFLKKNPKKIDAKDFRNLPTALQKTVILKAYKNLIGNTYDLEKSHLQEVLKIIHANIGNKKKKIGLITVSLSGNIIKLEKIAGKAHYE